MPVQQSACCDVPAHPFDLVLGRPTSNSVTVSLLCHGDEEGRIEFGTARDKLENATPPRTFKAGEPAEIVLGGLKPDTACFYRLRLAQTNSEAFPFHTARAPGRTFTFTITADSHLDENTDPAAYRRTLAGALADAPDFHIDLGDTFMTEKHSSRDAAFRQYLAQRFYFGELSRSAPLFLVLGNHDGEGPRGRGDESDSLSVWSNTMRKRFFPNPEPNGFYTGNSVRHPEAGLLQDYYAWTWGNALFVVLDPYWYTQGARGQRDNWKRSLGEDQYRWLKRTLESSRSPFKFVFIHHLVGGFDEQGRGGAEAASFFEWGGRDPDGGADVFKEKRPGWPSPIHPLLVQNRVNIVFHGHDHLFAKQELDGLVYQEVPQPGAPRATARKAAEYGYRDGVILGGAGHLRVTVAPRETAVEYVESTPESRLAHRYVLRAP